MPQKKVKNKGNVQECSLLALSGVQSVDPKQSTEDAAEVKKGNVARVNDAYDDFKGHLDTEPSLVII